MQNATPLTWPLTLSYSAGKKKTMYQVEKVCECAFETKHKGLVCLVANVSRLPKKAKKKGNPSTTKP